MQCWWECIIIIARFELLLLSFQGDIKYNFNYLFIFAYIYFCTVCISREKLKIKHNQFVIDGLCLKLSSSELVQFAADFYVDS